MTNRTFDRRGMLSLGAMTAAGVILTACGNASPAAATRYQVMRTPAQWRRQLGADRFRILREAGTERPFSSPLNKEHRRGTFVCAGCALPLYSSTTKFDSGTGWPSFYAALPNAIATTRDVTFGMERIESHCRRCGGHLGHIFDDGPKPTGKRHCINGLSLAFKTA